MSDKKEPKQNQPQQHTFSKKPHPPQDVIHGKVYLQAKDNSTSVQNLKDRIKASEKKPTK